MFIFVGLFLGYFMTVTGWQCPNDEVIQCLYVKPGQPAILRFQTILQSSSQSLLYNVVTFNNSNLYTAIFYNNALQIQLSYFESEFIGDARTGNFTVKTADVHKQDGGVYFLQYIIQNVPTVEMCSMLFVLGKPQRAQVSHDNNNVLGRNSQLSCSSVSTTFPTNHTTSFTYTWKVNDVTNPANTRYIYSSSRKTLTIMSVSKEDANKRFKCSATESGGGVTGFSSDYSDEFLFTVIYGPDSSTTSLVPTNTEYTLNEGVPLNDITCVGDCYPSCNFKWTKPGINGAVTVTNNAVLSLGSLSRTEAATYTCVVTNPSNTGKIERKEVVVNVNFGPDVSTTTLTPPSTSYTLNTGDPINDIHCSGICYPTCNYKWTKTGNNGFTPVNSARLSLGSLDRTKSGTYTCTVSNPSTGRKLTKIVSVFVRYGPDISSTTLNPADTSYTLNENTHLDNITCMADCYPECSYKWTKSDNTLVSNNGVLSLGTLKRNKAGTYTCAVTRSGTYVSVTKQVTVFVIYGPDAGSLTLVPVKTTYTENEGRRLNDITCSAACYPACNYKWTNSRTNTVVSGGVLSLGIMNKNMAATYTCTATNPRIRSTAVTNVILHVRYGPDACNVSVPSPLTLTEGETSPLISCEADCYPSCSHTWNNMSSSRSVGGSGNFQLVKSTRYQAGYYQCLCKNIAVQYGKNQTSTLKVVIEYPPDVTVSLSTENITVGNSLTLSCDSNGVPSVYQYNGLTQTWNAFIIPNSNREVSGSPEHSSLHIPSLQLQDSGIYTCYVNNGVKTVDSTSSMNLKVRVFPKVLTLQLTFAGETGGIANISVQFYSFPAVQKVVFQRYDNQTISSDTDKKYTVTVLETAVHDKFYRKDVTLNGMQADLLITNLKEEDFGTYTLILENEVGDITETLTLNAESRPLQPKDFQILTDLSNPTFLWQKDFNGGLEQSFVIQTMLAGSQQWNSKINVNERATNYQINSTFYMAKIGGLQPGIYIARIFSRNRKGDSEYVYLGTTFDVGEKESSTEGKSSFAAPIAAGVSSAVVVVVVVIGITAFLIWKKRTIKGQTDKGTYKNNQSGPSSQVQYEDLQGEREKDQAQTYESLDETYNETSAYASLTDKTDRPATTIVNSGNDATGSDAVYENLKLKGMTAAYIKAKN